MGFWGQIRNRRGSRAEAEATGLGVEGPGMESQAWQSVPYKLTWHLSSYSTDSPASSWLPGLGFVLIVSVLSPPDVTVCLLEMFLALPCLSDFLFLSDCLTNPT